MLLRTKAVTPRHTVFVTALVSLSLFGMQGMGQELDWYELLHDPDTRRLTDLASRYENGKGSMRRDYGRARQLYCAAARLGHGPAQVRLAWMYAYGVGVPQDRELAGAWLRVAAAKGDSDALKFLAFLGYPPRGRQPRCTYLSRFDRYAVATIPPARPEGSSAAVEGVSAIGAAEKSIVGSEVDPTRQQIEEWVRRLAPRYGLDAELVLAVIGVESNFNPRARSPKNAWGLMQLIPDTAARFGVRDSTHPIQNLHGGMSYLRWLLAYFRGDLQLALAGYNAGEGAVEKHRGVPPYQETKTYVRKVIRAYGRNTHPKVDQVVKPSKVLPTGLTTKQPR